MSEPLWDAAELGRRLGCSRSMVHKLADQGALGCVLVGRLRRFRPSDLADYLSRHEVQPTGPKLLRVPTLAIVSDINVDAELERQFGRAI